LVEELGAKFLTDVVHVVHRIFVEHFFELCFCQFRRFGFAVFPYPFKEFHSCAARLKGGLYCGADYGSFKTVFHAPYEVVVIVIYGHEVEEGMVRHAGLFEVGGEGVVFRAVEDEVFDGLFGVFSHRPAFVRAGLGDDSCKFFYRRADFLYLYKPAGGGDGCGQAAGRDGVVDDFSAEEPGGRGLCEFSHGGLRFEDVREFVLRYLQGGRVVFVVIEEAQACVYGVDAEVQDVVADFKRRCGDGFCDVDGVVDVVGDEVVSEKVVDGGGGFGTVGG